LKAAMEFQEHIPSFPLGNFIERIFYYQGFSPPHQLDRFLPDGNTEFIIDLGDTPQSIYDNETLAEVQVCRRAWVSGIRTHPITIPSGRDSRMLIVAFRKGKAYPFYPLPMSEITDVVVSADLIFGADVLDLREQMLAAPSIRHMFSLVEAFLLKRAKGMLSADTSTECVDNVLTSMVHKSDRLSLQQLSDQIGYSQKHFIQLFKKQVGVPPGQYLKIMRFQKTIREIEMAGSIHWSEIALRNGYYDQAHFIHEFKTYSGFTPGEYMIRKTDMLNYVPVY
jgi:AraC-like DNA-binding protein